MGKVGWISAVVVVGFIGVHLGPMLLSHSEQDACRFGTVSNEEYRSLLSKARASLGRWRPFQTWSDDGVSLQLNGKFQELLTDSSSSAMKVAAAHALLRSLGADFRNVTDMKSSVPDAKIRRAINYHYLLDVNRLFYFSPLPRGMFIIVSLRNPSLVEPRLDTRSELRITAHLPNLIEWSRVDRGPSACPPIPSN